MDFDPNPPTGERNRSGPRWYSVVAFLTIAFLLLLNAVAMFVNADANQKEACYAEAAAWNAYYAAGTPSAWAKANDYVYGMLSQCAEDYVD